MKLIPQLSVIYYMFKINQPTYSKIQKLHPTAVLVTGEQPVIYYYRTGDAEHHSKSLFYKEKERPKP